MQTTTLTANKSKAADQKPLAESKAKAYSKPWQQGKQKRSENQVNDLKKQNTTFTTDVLREKSLNIIEERKRPITSAAGEGKESNQKKVPKSPYNPNSGQGKSREVSTNRPLSSKRSSQQVDSALLINAQVSHRRGKSREQLNTLKPLNTDLQIQTNFPGFTPQNIDKTPVKSVPTLPEVKETASQKKDGSRLKRSHTPSLIQHPDNSSKSDNLETKITVTVVNPSRRHQLEKKKSNPLQSQAK